MRPRTRLVLFALLVFLAQAWRGAGYYNPDEYFQTVEFASYKLGITPASELPWEFAAKMRPFLQPAAYVGLWRGLDGVGLSDPGVALFVFRLTGALLAWLSLCLLATAFAMRLPDERQKTFVFLGCLLTWYVPFLSARTSSENFSGSLLAIGFGSFFLLAERPRLAALCSGLALGLSFDLRYQTGLAVVGFFAWLALVRRSALSVLAVFAAGVLLAVAVGLAVDRWGYGEWVAAPWNYLRANLIEGRSLQWGRQPATFYLTSFLEVHAPLSSLLLGAVILFWVRSPRDPITWTTVPFVAVHCLLSHKELRFLFPLAPLAAAILPLLLFDPGIGLGRARAWLARHRRLLPAVVSLNFAFLAALLAVPIRHELSVQTSVYRELEASPHAPVVLLRTEPFVDNSLTLGFLRPKGFQPVRVDSWPEVAAFVDSAKGPVSVVARLAELPPAPFRERYRPRLVAAPLPLGIARLLARPIGRTGMLALWSIGTGSPP